MFVRAERTVCSSEQIKQSFKGEQNSMFVRAEKSVCPSEQITQSS